MTENRYTKEHEWVRLEEGVAAIGITRYAIEQIGDVVYVELPQVDRGLVAGEAAAVIESVKAANEVYAPLSGKVTECNAEILDNYDLFTDDPEGAAWLFRLAPTDPSVIDKLMSREEYARFVAGA